MLNKAYLEITNVCNLSCSFCHKTSRPKHFLSAEEFDFLTDRLRSGVRYLYFHLMGEPLLHPLLPDFIASAHQKGFIPIITTNGSLLAQKGDALLTSPLHKISISLHAPAANPTFADPAYLDNCFDFARRASDRGIYTVLRLWNIGSEDEPENAHILARLRERFPDEWKPMRGGDSMRLHSRVFLEFAARFDWPDPSAPAIPPDSDLFCHALRDQIGILADGTAVPCCLDADAHLALGNLFDTPLEDILASPRARGIYDSFTSRRAKEDLCLRCGYARRFSHSGHIRCQQIFLNSPEFNVDTNE